MEVLLGLSAVLRPNSCKRYIANVDCLELHAYILQGDTHENIHYVAKTSYCIIEQVTTYYREKFDLNAMLI
jgi:hypothetical protein